MADTQSSSSEHIWILGLPGGENDEAGDRSRVFRRDDAAVRRQAVPVHRLQSNVGAFVAAMGQAIESVPHLLAGYSMESIEISAEVSATGSVSLLGTGGEVSGTGGITFTLTRVNDKQVAR
jgi:hypothetical protein